MAEIRKRVETASVCTNELVQGSHLFKITGYSLLLKFSGHEYIQSQAFEVGGHIWAINYYPRYHLDYSSIFIVQLSEGMNVRVKGWFQLLINKLGTPSCMPPHNDDAFLTFEGRGTMCGIDHYVKNTDLLPYLQDDSITIRCTLCVLTASLNPLLEPCYTPWEVCLDLGKLLQSGEGADVIFNVKGKLFPAHKCILAARSPYFHALFYGRMKKSEIKQLKVQDVEPAVFKALLSYIYTDHFPEIEQLGADYRLQLSHTQMAQKLIPVADFYLIDRLKKFCQDILCYEISNSNVAMFLALSEQYNCNQLKYECLVHLSVPETLALVILTDGFSEMMSDCPSLLKDIKEITSNQFLKKTLSELQNSLAIASHSTSSSLSSSKTTTITAAATTKLLVLNKLEQQQQNF